MTKGTAVTSPRSRIRTFLGSFPQGHGFEGRPSPPRLAGSHVPFSMCRSLLGRRPRGAAGSFRAICSIGGTPGTWGQQRRAGASGGVRVPGARVQGDTGQRASSRPRPHPRLRRRPEPERARLRHPRPVPDRGAPDAPRPPAGPLAGLQHYPTRRPGLRVPLGRSAWPPPRPACADGRPGHRGPLLSHPTRTPDPLPGARLLVPLDGALAPLC